MRPWLPRVLPLALALAPMLACDPAGTTTPGASEEDKAAERARQRQASLDAERARLNQELEEAQAAFEAAFETEVSVETFTKYATKVAYVGRQSPDVLEGVDIASHYANVLDGAGKDLLDQLLAEWSNKKQRTRELHMDLKTVYDYRIKVRRVQQVEVAAGDDEAALLALGTPSADWTIGGAVWVTDAFLIEQVETRGGREATQQMCRSALDLIIADDKRDKPRQYYVMQVCLSTRSDWEADLAQWTKANDTKEFRKAYAPYHAERAAEIAAAQRELDARRQAEAEALWGSKSDDAAAGGSSSSGSSGSSAGPVSVTLRNSCGSGVKLFYGDNPEFGSGRTDSLSGNSRTSKQLQAGQKVWLVDDRKQGIANATVSSSTREIEVTCSGINLH